MDTTIKACQKCNIDKPINEFHRDNSRNDGRAYVCKACRRTHRHAYYERQKEKLRANYNPEEARNIRLVRTYGITSKDYDAMVKAQNGVCAICCQTSYKNLHVDHDHDTGRVRGLLCSPCNTSLGGFRDSIENLKRAIKYLE